MPGRPEKFFSVDVEANGPIPGVYSMTALGCCVVGEPERAFYAELKPISANVDPEAERVGGLTLDYLEANGEHPAQAMRRFDAWVRQTAGEGCRPVFVAFNATFDWMFTNWYLVRFVGRNPFSVSGLDIKAYYMGMMNVDWADTVKRRIPAAFQSGRRHTHHALEDARAQAEMFEKMLAYNAARKEVG